MQNTPATNAVYKNNKDESRQKRKKEIPATAIRTTPVVSDDDGVATNSVVITSRGTGLVKMSTLNYLCIVQEKRKPQISKYISRNIETKTWTALLQTKNSYGWVVLPSSNN